VKQGRRCVKLRRRAVQGGRAPVKQGRRCVKLRRRAVQGGRAPVKQGRRCVKVLRASVKYVRRRVRKGRRRDELCHPADEVSRRRRKLVRCLVHVGRRLGNECRRSLQVGRRSSNRCRSAVNPVRPAVQLHGWPRHCHNCSGNQLPKFGNQQEYFFDFRCLATDDFNMGEYLIPSIRNLFHCGCRQLAGAAPSNW
jgi:hypothetical protein